MKSWGRLSEEGRANIRRARETLKPGDVIRCNVAGTPDLIAVVIANDNNWRYLKPLFSSAKPLYYQLHNDWELLGHYDLPSESEVGEVQPVVSVERPIED